MKRIACPHKESFQSGNGIDQVSTRLLAPICPHTCDHMWRAVLGRSGSVLTAGWPQAEAPDATLSRAAAYLQDQIASLRTLIAKVEAPPKKAKKGAPLAVPSKVRQHACSTYLLRLPPHTSLAWQQCCADSLQKRCNPLTPTRRPSSAVSALRIRPSQLPRVLYLWQPNLADKSCLCVSLRCSRLCLQSTAICLWPFSWPSIMSTYTKLTTLKYRGMTCTSDCLDGLAQDHWLQSTCLGISQLFGQVMVVNLQVTHCDMYVAEQYGGWQEATLQYLGLRFNPDSQTFPPDTMAGVVPAVQQAGAGGGQPDKALKGTVIPFAKLKSDEAIAIGGQVWCIIL